jgi:hypothetical protein
MKPCMLAFGLAILTLAPIYSSGGAVLRAERRYADQSDLQLIAGGSGVRSDGRKVHS